MVVVLASALVTVLLKAAGAMVLAGRPLPEAGSRVMALLAPALLSALVVTQTFSSGPRLTVDARTAGLAAAAVCVVLRAPLLLTVVVAAAVTAALRALG
jgi:branched-subunit amino acid transport protein